MSIAPAKENVKRAFFVCNIVAAVASNWQAIYSFAVFQKYGNASSL